MNDLPPAPKPWGFWDRVGAFVIGGVTVPALLLAVVGFVASSERYLVPEAIVYSKGGDDVWYATFKRRTPRGAVHAEWAVEMSVVTGMECHAPADGMRGEAFYQPVPERIARETGDLYPADTVTYPVSLSLVPCLEAEPPIIGEATYWVLAFGVIPLRPVSLPFVIE